MTEACTVSTHVLDAVLGRPAAGVRVTLSRLDGGAPQTAVTDADGRVSGWATEPGPHRIRFATGDWFAARDIPTFYPEVEISFTAAAGHSHVPLLLSPFAYSTYRGS
ncbi:hydroxyisourate hydrolase [Glycomyces sp. NPDC048151]|uniref:hydroxyisourate hydrolase n=1 Tax=Glycomyces sp. NPDC048151 TaxID=3364002 RepID=UPI003724373B